MSTETSNETTVMQDLERVREGFAAFARGDLAAFAASFHDDATWNHRNPDRLGGIHEGSDRIVAFVAESAQLSGGSLRAIPLEAMADGSGCVAVHVQVSAERPDGRRLDDHHVLLFRIEDDRVRSVDQFVGDPPAVTAFWA